jgi:hypothetical protein
MVRNIVEFLGIFLVNDGPVLIEEREWRGRVW